MQIIDGKKIAEKINNGTAKDVFSLINRGYRHPHLAIILVGEREDSKLYTSLKEKVAKEVGIDTSLYLIDKDDDKKKLIDIINFLNNDDSVDGILVQLPLPEKFETDKILPLIESSKDVDGFNTKKIFYSPVVLATKYSLEESKIDYKNKKAFLFFNSNVFKEEMENFLNKFDISLSAISSQELNKLITNPDEFKKIQNKVKQCDIVISAMGQAEIITSDFLNDDMVIIDIGITKNNKKVTGDIKFLDTQKLNGYITPVPGGIGPITVACLLKNVLQSYLLKVEKQK